MSNAAGEERLYLDSYLAPLAAILARTDVTDVYVNQPGEVWLETSGGATERHDIPMLTESMLSRLTRQIAAFAHQGISRAHPLLSATLPDGTRVQVVGPPATRGAFALAFRKYVVASLSLADHAAGGTFDEIGCIGKARSELTEKLQTFQRLRRYHEMLALAVKSRCNILISGGTSSGKTTFLNSLITEISLQERLIFIEDTPELHTAHPNSVGLIAARNALGEADVSVDSLLGAALRMRPDRIILGELRGSEVLAFLRAVNSGHPGSMTTIHADDPSRAIEQIVLLALQTGTRLNREDIRQYTLRSIDVFVQTSRIDGKRRVEEISLSEQIN